MGTRIVTGLSLGIVMIASLLWNAYSATTLMTVIAIFSIMEWGRHFCSVNDRPFFYLLSAAILGTAVVCAFVLTGLPTGKFLTICSGATLGLMGHFVYALWFGRPMKNLGGIAPGIIYIMLPLSAAVLFLSAPFEEHRWVILSFIMVNWSNDTMAYFGGRMFGRTPLAPAISPKKTVEGSLTGWLGGVGALFIFDHFFPLQLHTFALVITGTALVVAGSLGDLFESSLKRSAGIKDSGTVLPGHGGFLDRFDSFFFVVPAGLLMLEIFKVL